MPEGTICNKLSSTIDILSTIAALTKSELPKEKLDEVKILDLLKGQKEANTRNSFLYYYQKNSLEAVRKETLS